MTWQKVDTRLIPIDPVKGQFGGYVAPFYRRGVGHGHYYYTPDTEFVFQPLLSSGTNEIFPVLYEHKPDEANRLGFVTNWLKDDSGVFCTLQFLHVPALDLVKPLIAAGTAYLCAGGFNQQMQCDLADDDRVVRCLFAEISIGRWPGVTPLTYKSDEDYVNAYGAATGFYPPEFDEHKLARPVARKDDLHVG